MPHIHDSIDFIVDAFIVHDSKVLLIHHKERRMWLQVGGHIELDEEPEEALFREIEEETGLKKENLSVLSKKEGNQFKNFRFLYTPNSLNIHKISDTHQHVSLTYFVRSKTNKVILASKEHHEIKWFSKNELTDKQFNIVPDVVFYALEALKKALEFEIK